MRAPTVDEYRYEMRALEAQQKLSFDGGTLVRRLLYALEAVQQDFARAVIENHALEARVWVLEQEAEHLSELVRRYERELDIAYDGFAA